MLWAEGGSASKFVDHIKAISHRFDGAILKIPVEVLEFVGEGFEISHCHEFLVHAYKIVSKIILCKKKVHFFFILKLARFLYWLPRKVLNIKGLRGVGRRKCLIISDLWRLVISGNLSRLFANFFLFFYSNFLLTGSGELLCLIRYENTNHSRR